MRTIWKYPVEVGRWSVVMPKGAQILAVQVQRGGPWVWALVDDEAEEEVRRFRVYGTGHPVDSGSGWEYVGTFQLMNGSFVGHVFVQVAGGSSTDS